MKKTSPLTAEQLYHSCDLSALDFVTTDSLPEFEGLFGQDRALEALRFGVGIKKRGFNIFVLGPPGIGKHTLVQSLLDTESDRRGPPNDWCYVNNFQAAHQPSVLQLPAGEGDGLARAMTEFVEALRHDIPAAFASDEYRSQLQKIEQTLKDEQDKAIEAIREKAKTKGIALMRTPNGFAFAPITDGDVLTPEQFEQLPDEEKQRIEREVDTLQDELRQLIQRVPAWRAEARAQTRALEKATAQAAVAYAMSKLKTQFQHLPAIVAFLEAVENDVLENIDEFRESDDSERGRIPMLAHVPDGPFARYQVNLLVDNAATKGAPVIYEDHPTYLNLVGRVEHVALMGALITDFRLIKPGALHRANGGYLILDAFKVLQHPYAWEGLKRALQSAEIRIQSLEQMLSLASTVSLEPERIPLDVKVVLLGDRMLYYLLYQLDPDFAELFKVAADFEDTVERSGQSVKAYAHLIATLARRHELKPLTATAVQRVIEHASRIIEDQERLSTHMRSITDVLCEADYWAGEAGRNAIDREDIEATLAAKLRRSDRVRERTIDAIRRGIVLVDTQGAKAGVVNGLSVVAVGDLDFGMPSRITATVRLGDGEVVDIEREVDLGGPFHSKGVHILTGYIGHYFAKERPLSLAARVVFEQSYAEIDGDSASAAELFALLSAIADVALTQSLAVTGSVSQKGDIQAIGAVNEKIEGFFDVCKTRGLTGEQGVIIPASNVCHLMLRQDIIEAARQGRFHIYPISHVNEGITLLSGLDAGEANEAGEFPEGTFNHKVSTILRRMEEHRHEHISPGKGIEDESNTAERQDREGDDHDGSDEDSDGH